MSFEINWNKLPSTGNKKSANKQKDGLRPLNFVKFGDGTTHIFRPVGKAHGFWRFYYAPARKYVNAKVILDKDGNQTESNVEEIKELLGCEPELRFAINVIDRADSQIKILQGPISILNDFAEIAQETQNKPGGKGGGDWKITSTGTGKKGSPRRYKCRFLGPQPFTTEELNRIQNTDPTKNEWYMLETICRPSNMDWVHKLISDQEPGNSVHKASQQNVTNQEIEDSDQEAVTAAAAMSNDDLDF